IYNILSEIPWNSGVPAGRPFLPPRQVLPFAWWLTAPRDCLQGGPPILKSDFAARPFAGTEEAPDTQRAFQRFPPCGERTARIDDPRTMRNSLDLEGRPEDTRV